MTKKIIYLDYAATTPMDPSVFKAMEQYFTYNFYNPSASYLAAKRVKKELDGVRAGVARHLGAKLPEIIFIAGATEANNLALQGVMKQFPDGEILISAVEHDSVRTPAWLFDCHEIPVTKQGIAEPLAVEKFISDNTVLVSVGLVNNETGTIQPLKEISSILGKVRAERSKKGNNRPIYLHTDAAQAGCYLSLNASRLGVDMMSINGGKIYGPKQSGALFVKTGVRLSPIIAGGGQEWGMRAGTENVPAIFGLAAALEKAQSLRTAESKRLTGLRELFIEKVTEALPNTQINGSKKHSAPHIVSATFQGRDNERLMMELDEAGIQCATGSACHAGTGTPSHVLAAMGLPDKASRSTLRFSFGRHTNENDIAAAIRELKRILSR
jgi:cysteine desulfurase